MKNAVVFYSRDGNTAAAAREIAALFSAQVFELKEKNGSRKGFFGFMRSGFQAAFHLKSKLVDDFSKKIAKYNAVYIGSPVWAGSGAPAVNTFVDRADLAGKDVYLFYVCASPESDYRPEGGIKYVSRAIMKKGGTVKGIYVFHGCPPGHTPDLKDIKSQVQNSLKL